MKNNTIKKLGKTAIATGLALLVEQGINAQNIYSQERKQKVMEAYYNAEDALYNGGVLPASAIRTLEDFLGVELYHGTSSGLQTIPSNGVGSIKPMNSEYWVNTVQVGSGNGKFMAENNRDMSFTWSVYANRAGYDGSDQIRNDDRLKQIIALNSTSGITPFEIDIQRDANGKILDILYNGTSTAKKSDVNAHRVMINGKMTGKIAKHILMVPGENFYIPLDDALTIAGFEFPVYEPTPLPPAEVPKPAEVPCDCEEEPVAKDSIVHTFAIGATGTSNGVPGLYLASQLGNCETKGLHKNFWFNTDLELGYAFRKSSKTQGAFEAFTEEVKPHQTLPITGHSELLEKGNTAKDLHMVNLDLIHYGKNRVFGAGLGLSADFVKENYEGKEFLTTYFTQEGNRDKMEYDETVMKAVKHINHMALNPTVALRLDLGFLRAGVDYILPVNLIDGVNKDKSLDGASGHYDSRYIRGNDGPGNFRFSIGIPINVRKSDNVDRCKTQSSQASTAGYYNRGSR